MKKIILLFSVLSLSCSQNFLNEASSRDYDQEYYTDAMNALNDQKFDDAIAIIGTNISPSGQAAPKVRELLAAAYAGKCGLNFINYTNALASQTSGSAMANVMNPFVNLEADPTSCRLALQTMELIGPTEARTNNQNIFASVTGMVLMGAALRVYADIAPQLGDGHADINLCTGFTDDQIDDIILGFGFFSKNFAAVTSSTVGSYSFSALGDVVTSCSNAAGAGACNITNPADITQPVRATFRGLVNTQEYGIGTFNTGGNPMMIPNSCP
jgi:hypothetical protein